MTPACAFLSPCRRNADHENTNPSGCLQHSSGWWGALKLWGFFSKATCRSSVWLLSGPGLMTSSALDHPVLPGLLIYRLSSRTLTNCPGMHADRQAALWVSAHTPDILAPASHTLTLLSKVLESIILCNHVLSVTGMALELGHTFKMWLFKVAAPVSAALRSRHKPGLQLLWVDMVSAINWNVRHF